MQQVELLLTSFTPGTVCSVLNILKLQQLISSAVLEITAVQTGHSICSAPSLKLVQPRVRGIFQKARAAGMKREPGVRFKWASLKLRSMQHIAELPPLSTDSTLCRVTYKLAGAERAPRAAWFGVIKGRDIQHFQGQEHVKWKTD